jgi:hypothetical protein
MPRGPVSVLVTIEGFELDGNVVRLAVAKELDLSVSDTVEGSPTHVTVSATHGGELVVTFRTDDGPTLTRVVSAPGRADEVPEATALLVGNLARDESAVLVLGLGSAAIAPPEPAPSPRADVPAKPAAQEPEPQVVDKPSRSEQPEPKEKPLAAFNASIFHPMTLVPNTHEKLIGMELGLFYSRLGGLRGAALSSGLLWIDGPSDGAQLAAIGHIHRGSGRGARIAGVFGVGEDDYRGFSAAGGVDIGKGRFEGLQLAGVAALHSGPFDGVQLAGWGTIAGEVFGIQVSGGMNLAHDVTGGQVPAVVNVARDVRGLQLGLINVGANVSGLQLGLVNVAEDVDGASVGLVTYSRKGTVQAVTWFNTTQPFNLGARFYTGPLYAMPTLGFEPGSDKDFAPGLSLGARLPIHRAFVDIDVNYSNPSDFNRFDEHNVDLRYRLLGGFQITEAFGVFAGGGVRHHFRTAGPSQESIDPELSAGVQFF